MLLLRALREPLCPGPWLAPGMWQCATMERELLVPAYLEGMIYF